MSFLQRREQTDVLSLHTIPNDISAQRDSKSRSVFETLFSGSHRATSVTLMDSSVALMDYSLATIW